MPTLQELFEEGEFGASTKVASAQSADLNDMDQLALSLGLLGDVGSEKLAEEDEKEEEDDDDEKEGGEKKASFGGGLHSLLFPDSPVGAHEKTAAEKLAAEEESLGAATYDMFSSAIDSFVEKMAMEALAGNPHGDSQAVNHLPNNKPADASQAINTDPTITDEVKATNDKRTVGHYEQKTAAALAFQKQLLLAQLNG